MHTSPQTPKPQGPRRAGRESTSGFEIFFTKKTFQKHQEQTRNMYPLLNQALRREENTQTANRNCQVQEARECSVQFPNVPSSRKQRARERLQDPRIPSRRKSGPNIPKHPRADADHVSTVEPDTKPTNVPASHRRGTTTPRAGATGSAACPGSSRTSRAPCPTAPTHGRCRQPTQCAHQMGSSARRLRNAI